VKKSPTAQQVSDAVEALLTAHLVLDVDAPRAFHRAPIVAQNQEGTRYVRLEIEPPPAFEGLHHRPAQYVTLKTSAFEPRFFVLAQAPGDAHWQFLIEAVADVEPFLEAIGRGEPLLVSAPEGSGFAPSGAVGRHAHLFATGSGIATMRPLIRHWLSEPSSAPRHITLYYGETSEEDFAYLDELDQWRHQGVEVFLTCGRGPTEKCPYQFVQHAFDATDAGIDDAVVYLSGAPIMIEVVADKLLRQGLAPESLLINI
jgi:NAD(P)H-flavin reductase